ncbi:hypothetical protein [Fictibacillus sp. B-59209]|uniref:hypothetical protein n=1 Tax=Fictibacillus sp. B-59209 TaxID=3024873 RepID=UPI003CD0DEA6
MRAGRTTIAIAHRLSTIQDADLILGLWKEELIKNWWKHEAYITKCIPFSKKESSSMMPDDPP